MTGLAQRLVAARLFDPLVLCVIVANAILLGVEIYEGIERDAGDTLRLLSGGAEREINAAADARRRASRR